MAKRTLAKNVWLFDIDGVLTNLRTRKLSLELIKVLAQKNKEEEPTTFVTGRSIAWIQKRIFPLLSKVDFSLVSCSCEKGGVFVTFNKEGEPDISVNEELKVPAQIQEEAHDIVEAQFSKTMFYDSKLTMVTVEAREDVENSAFRADQKFLDEQLLQIIKNHKLEDTLKLDSAEIATDIESKKVNKYLGVAETLRWIKKKSIEIKHVYGFGDRGSDVDIGKYLHEKGLPFTFVFTGGKDELKSHDFPFEIVITDKLYDQGTLEFFTNLKLDT